ncbi:MAG: fused MFS/spermidine synthase [Pseudomonadota bacterium]|nr:fused MFS/spermidine synthase [Pseudomonadota bacterium]
MKAHAAGRSGSIEEVRDALPFIREEHASKSLYFSIEDVQSRMQLQRPDALDLRYTRTMMAFLMFQPAPSRIAMVGLGGGSLAKFCFRHLPAARIDVIEINPHVIALRDDFKVPADGPRFRVIEADGAAFMGEAGEAATRYDVVMLDAFGRHGLPRSLGTQRFYDDCADALTPGGVLVSNFHSAASDFPACVERLRRSFGGAVVVVDDRERINSIVFASRGGVPAVAAALRVARPKVLDKTAWAQLSGAFERVATVLDGPADIALARDAR